ncbi:hypothetical protein N658DRAFT_510033 [Parathielavia hyrcaniae]|uniref:Uncharacterized protein n=1 Tax=Parathielavia hyrcaniae TaxID=113614 RepID=A0AAN6SYV3_9PEZI|nr:hypothetical protein N658DRAFT_510033 [Parathielavia hyrcaniae]
MEAPNTIAEDGFESSPYSGYMVTLAFADPARGSRRNQAPFNPANARNLLKVHRCILLREVKPSERVDLTSTYVDLTGHSAVAGHALVHYLYHKELELPRWNDDDDDGEPPTAASLQANLEVYTLARRLELEDLQNQVRPAIEWGSCGVDMYTIMDAIKQACPSPNIVGNDPWFTQWFKLHLKEALQDPDRRSVASAAAVQHGSMYDDSGVVKLMFECMRETYAETVGSMSLDTRNHSGPLTPATEGSFGDGQEQRMWGAEDEESGTVRNAPPISDESIGDGEWEVKMEFEPDNDWRVESKPDPEPAEEVQEPRLGSQSCANCGWTLYSTMTPCQVCRHTADGEEDMQQAKPEPEPRRGNEGRGSPPPYELAAEPKVEPLGFDIPAQAGPDAGWDGVYLTWDLDENKSVTRI